jgi:hypothetical protein
MSLLVRARVSIQVSLAGRHKKEVMSKVDNPMADGPPGCFPAQQLLLTLKIFSLFMQTFAFVPRS